MAFHYPNGRRFVPQAMEEKKSPLKKISYSNRGKTLEDDLNETNQYYLAHGIAVIHKKPTPIQIVDVHYPKRSAAVIKEAYFKQASTTDYNGVYKGKYIDFEAKETKNSSSFPLKNFHDHQIEHMKHIIQHDGIAFVIIRFSAMDDIYLMSSEQLSFYWKRMKEGGRKSITLQEVESSSRKITLGFQPRIDYIKVVDSLISENF
ncbi:Holliday junction resolvase RecU [Peribacillus frigoritolerans]|uniref:Holliday junction resolvase RecU n=2 Tax=Peribacillus TaxID=2675229 RepID=A0AAW9NA75_9BACI|nr:Holliday junction resolvase RecU [Peribacillus castrilensis]MEC0300043.1 Holliday junction resolvase RecU [Peribacillus castrilensis]MEC0344414.1 Holliday junction resolvase RecU [Peribacillus castrilensis]